MSNLAAEVTLEWADGTYLFRLPVSRLIELEQKCAASFTTVHRRLVSGSPTITDIYETIRLGLIGGGLDPVAALTLVKRYVDDAPKVPNMITAAEIMKAVMFGFEVEDLGKGEAAPTVESPNASTSPASTPQPLSSAGSPSRTWTGSRYGNGQPL